MSGVQWVIMALFEALAVLAVLSVIRLWQGDGNVFEGLRVDQVRALPTIVLGGTIAINLLLLFGVLGPTDKVTVLSLVGAVVLPALLAGLVVVSTTLWFRGWPQRLVPPHLRGVERSEEYRPPRMKRTANRTKRR
jgi:hypothetical protein